LRHFTSISATAREEENSQRKPKERLVVVLRRIAQIRQDAQLSQTDRAAGCIIVFAKSRRVELVDNILRTL